jgi:hypothetical protein
VRGTEGSGPWRGWTGQAGVGAAGEVRGGRWLGVRARRGAAGRVQVRGRAIVTAVRGERVNEMEVRRNNTVFFNDDRNCAVAINIMQRSVRRSRIIVRVPEGSSVTLNP